MPSEDVGQSPRVGVVRELLNSAPDGSAPELEGIRFVLEALHYGKGRTLRAAGWTGGPFVPADRSKFEK